MKEFKALLNGIATKLAILTGGTALLSAANGVGQLTNLPIPEPGQMSAPTPGFRNGTLSKLILKQQKSGYRLIAQHDSHDSHDSHASHDSHSSHASSAH